MGHKLRHAGGNSRRNQRLSSYPLEIGAQLDGVIRSKWRGKPFWPESIANVLAPRMADGASAVTDSLRRFHITGIEWADSAILCNKRHELKGKTRRENIHPEFDSFPNYRHTPRIAVNSRIVRRSRRRPRPMGQLRGTTQILITAGNANLTTRSRGPRHQKARGANAIDYLASVYIRPDNNKDIRSYEGGRPHIPRLT